MKRFYALTLALMIVAPAFVQAQNDADVIRFSQFYPTGTARSAAMGGAFGALGGDFTSLSINPAGIGVYRKGEFTLTPDIYYDKSTSKFYGQSYDDFKYRFLLNNMGFVVPFNTNKDNGWVSAGIAFGYNRLADFHRNITVSADNTQSSMLDEFLYYADGVDTSSLDPNYEALAWKTDLMYLPDNASMPWAYASDMNYYDFDQSKWVTNYNQSQERQIITKGGIDEYNLTFGANYSNKLYLGMALGLTHVSYDEQNIQTEWDANGSISTFSSFRFGSYFNTHGNGFTAKFGAIYKPVEILRLGLAIHLPTFYDLSSEFYTSMNSSFDPEPGFPSTMYARSDMSVCDYRVITPMRMVGSVGLQFGKSGLLSADYEFVNYKNARIDGDLDNFDDVNDNIRDYYRAAGNLRLGGEYRLGNLSFRGGYAHYGSPYKSGQLNEKSATSVLSAGLGIRSGNFSLDFAYTYTMRPYKLAMYYDGFNDTEYYADTHLHTTRVMATFGFRF